MTTAAGAHGPGAARWVAELTRRHLPGLRRSEIVILAAVVLGGALARASLLREPMRYDEAFTFLTYVRLPVRAITLTYTYPNNHVLNSLLMHWSWSALGNHLWSLRLPAFLAGCAAPVAAWAAARALYDPVTGILAAALTASFAPMVDFSVNARGYAIGLLLLFICTWLAARLLDGGGLAASRSFIVLGALAVYAVPTMALGLAAIATWALGSVLLRGRSANRALIRRLVAMSALTGLLATLLYWPLVGQPGWTFVPPLPKEWGAIRHLAAVTWASWHRAAPHPLDWLLVVGVLTSVLAHRRIAQHRMPLAVASVLTLAAFVIFTKRIPPFSRSWLELVPFYLLTASAGLAYLAERVGQLVGRPRTAALVTAIVAGVAFGGSVLHAGQAGSEEPPSSDNNIVGFLKVHFPGEGVLMDQPTFAPSVNYYLDRDHYPYGVGAVTPRQRHEGHALVIGPFTAPSGAAYIVGTHGGRPVPRTARVVKRFRYITVFDVPLARGQ